MARKSKRNYFGRDTEEAIIKYNDLTNRFERSKLYEEEIHPALNKLVENVIHKYKFYHYDSTYADLKHETVAYIHERLNKFVEGNGKAFSYFTIVARNYLIVRTKETYDSLTAREELVVVDDERDLDNEEYTNERQELLSEFVVLWSEWGIDNIHVLFSSERDQRIAEAVFTIFGDCKNIDNYNKKALYILIREHAKVKTQYITKVVRRLRTIFGSMVMDYLDHGVIDWDEYLELNLE